MLKQATTGIKFISTNKYRSSYNYLIVQCCLASLGSPDMKLSKIASKEKKSLTILIPVYDS